MLARHADQHFMTQRLNLTVTGSLQTLEALGHEVLIRVARQQPLDSKS